MCVMPPEPISNLSVRLYVYPSLSLLGNVSVKTLPRQRTIEELVDASFAVQSVSHQRKIGDNFFPELLSYCSVCFGVVSSVILPKRCTKFCLYSSVLVFIHRISKVSVVVLSKYCPDFGLEGLFIIIIIIDRLCGLVVRVPGYRSRCPGFDSRRYQIF
jgi:hypothetical protein